MPLQRQICGGSEGSATITILTMGLFGLLSGGNCMIADIDPFFGRLIELAVSPVEAMDAMLATLGRGMIRDDPLHNCAKA